MGAGYSKASPYGEAGYNTAGTGRPMKFYDKTNQYKGMTIQEFEKATRNRKSEYIGIADDTGRIIIAGTSFNKGSVAIPTTHPLFKDNLTMTHNHPAENGRYLGGSFSSADVVNGIALKFKVVRANANEKTYIISRNTKATQAQINRLYKRATTSDARWSKTANKRLSAVNKKIKGKGKSLSPKAVKQITLGYGTRLWKELTKNTGYTYTEIRAKNRK